MDNAGHTLRFPRVSRQSLPIGSDYTPAPPDPPILVIRSSADLHHKLPEVLALEQADERLRSFAEAVDHRLPALELAGPQEAADFAHELAHQARVVGDDE